ncbi:hydroxymethylglutaryl-CoA reductase, partial [Actinotignum timonense]|nr:hydroxymethylglutaryl-CoA reductase [Actinotignum timonense]
MTDSRITPDSHTPIPTKWVGPIHISGPVLSGAVEVPLATYETPLWPSCNRGADVSRMVEGGICVCVADERMSRSVLFIAEIHEVVIDPVAQLSISLLYGGSDG